jgi:hypothetical protein
MAPSSIANSGSALVYANGHLIPRIGLWKPARLTSSQSGPYTILENENILTVKVGKNLVETIEIELPIGPKIQTDVLVDVIKKASVGIREAFSRDANGQFIPIYDVEGNPVMELVRDTNGNPIPLTDNGVPIQEEDIDGNLLWHSDGEPKYKYQKMPAYKKESMPYMKFSVRNIKGRLSLTDAVSSPNESAISVSGACLGFLGLSLQRRAEAKKIYPGWFIAQVERNFSMPSYGPEAFRYIKFAEPIKSNPNFKVSFVTSALECKRCLGTYVENDLRYGKDGEIFQIENEDLLYQASLKMILTSQGSNPYHPWYGTSIMDRIGSKAVVGVSTLIQDEISKAITKFQGLQGSQSKYQMVTQKEKLLRVTSVSVLPNANDPTMFMIEMTIANAAMEPVKLSIVYSAPGAVALKGTNQKSLGTQAAGVVDASWYDKTQG